ncbi:MAG: hypothetical protein ALAOOOJD_03374 [bacterium]|nr:hypothetical protein [bacterium]
METYHATERSAHRAHFNPPGHSDHRPRQVRFRGRRVARRLCHGGLPGHAGGDSNRHRLRSTTLFECARAVGKGGHQIARGEHAVLESLRTANAGVLGRSFAELRSRACRRRSRLDLRLAALRRPARRRQCSGNAHVRRVGADQGFAPGVWADC